MVTIKGLKIPKCCKECPLFHFYVDIEGVMHFICKYGNVEVLEYDKKRNDTCPLQEPCKDYIKISEGTTNGDVIKAVFGFEPRENICIIPKELCNGNPAECDGCRFNNFWNSPYRKEQK